MIVVHFPFEKLIERYAYLEKDNRDEEEDATKDVEPRLEVEKHQQNEQLMNRPSE